MDCFPLCMCMHAFVWVVNACKMFLQILVERKFESGIESSEITVRCVKVNRNVVQPDGFSVSHCYGLVLASLY